MPQFLVQLELSSLDGSNGFQINGNVANGFSGYSVASAGDVNGDGFDDIIIGNGANGLGGIRNSDIFVVFGRKGAFASTLDLSSLDGSNGFQISGETTPDLRGRSVSSAGDINGDGFDDVIVGAPLGNSSGFSNDAKGASYVVFGKAGGFDADLKLSSLDGSNGFRINGEENGGRSGNSVSSAGDINGDGFDDVIVGAYLVNAHGHDSGASYVVFGKAGGFSADIVLSALDGNTGFQINGVAARDFFGSSVSSAGDVNGDGFDDIIIGAAEADPNGDGSGTSYVVFGKASGFAANFELSALDGSNGFRISGEKAGNFVGHSVASAGDVNGDGIGDIVVRSDEAGYVVFGKATGFSANLDLGALDGSNGFKVASGGIGGGSSAGDVNGDGFDDVIFGAGFASPNGQQSGASYVVFGKADGFDATLDVSELDGDNGFVINGERNMDRSGSSVSSAGDINGDGFDDMIVGAPWAGPHHSYAGASYVIFGHRALTAVTITGSDIAQTSNGGHGEDTISGNGGNDTLIGWEAADTLDGGAGADTLQGDGGADALNGGDAADTLEGGNGADTLNGNDGSDTLSGGLKRDILTGGAGDDVFVFLATNEGRDTITDFGSGDLVDISAIDVIAGGGDDDFAFGGTTATANGVWYSVGPARATVFLDTDGDTATAELVIYLSGVTSLAQGDFIL